MCVFSQFNELFKSYRDGEECFSHERYTSFQHSGELKPLPKAGELELDDPTKVIL